MNQGRMFSITDKVFFFFYQEANVCVCIIVFKSLRFSSPTLKRNFRFLNEKREPAVVPKLSCFSKPPECECGCKHGKSEAFEKLWFHIIGVDIARDRIHIQTGKKTTTRGIHERDTQTKKKEAHRRYDCIFKIIGTSHPEKCLKTAWRCSP